MISVGAGAFISRTAASLKARLVKRREHLQFLEEERRSLIRRHRAFSPHLPSPLPLAADARGSRKVTKCGAVTSRHRSPQHDGPLAGLQARCLTLTGRQRVFERSRWQQVSCESSVEVAASWRICVIRSVGEADGDELQLAIFCKENSTMTKCLRSFNFILSFISSVSASFGV